MMTRRTQLSRTAIAWTSAALVWMAGPGCSDAPSTDEGGQTDATSSWDVASTGEGGQTDATSSWDIAGPDATQDDGGATPQDGETTHGVEDGDDDVSCVSDAACDEADTTVCDDAGDALHTCVEVSPGCLQLDAPVPCPNGCVDGACVTGCAPDCAGKDCGDDGCGGSCGAACDDLNPCTDDTCKPPGLCTFTPNTVACEDEDTCTTGDTCQMGVCVAGEPLDCQDDNPCSTDSCDPEFGCIYAAVDDGELCQSDACTVGGTCTEGECGGGDALDCTDEDPCTAETCDPDIGCTYPLAYEGCEPVEVTCDDTVDNDQDGQTDCADEDCEATCCADGAQSGEETGVDCGGACLKCPGDPCEATEECAQGWCNEADICAPPKTYYWVGGSGEWSDYAAHWATTSGGDVFHTSVPTPVDDVFFDASSFPEPGGTIELDMLVAMCRHMDWTGATGDPLVTGDAGKELILVGSLTLVEGMGWSSQGDLIFTGPGGATIDTQGVSLSAYAAHLDDPDGKWTLTSALTGPNLYLHIDQGTFDTGGFDLTVRRFISANSNPRTILLNDSTIDPGQFWFMGSTENLTFDAGTSTVVWTAHNTYRFEGGDAVFHALLVETTDGQSELRGDTTFSTITKTGPGELEVTDGLLVTESLSVAEGMLTLAGNTTIETLVLGAGTFCKLGSGQTQTVGTLSAVGDCTEYITLHATTPGAAATLFVAEGQVLVVYGALRDIAATGGANFHAAQSYDEGGNSGWEIEEPEPQNYYWIGGSGDWSDPAHWSTESGGEPAECVRGSSDSVFFDANSFTEGSSTVTLDSPEATCHHMDWTGAAWSPTLTGASDHHLTVTGDLTLVQDLSWPATGDLWLRGDGDKTVTPHDVDIGSYGLHIDGEAGTWTLASPLLLTGGYLYVDRGTFDTAGHDLNVRRFISANTNTRTILLQDATIYLNQFWFMSQTDNLTFDAGTSTIVWGASNTYRFEGGDATFYDLEVTVSGGEADIHDDTTFHAITKGGIGRLAIDGGLTVEDTLQVDQGTLALESSTTLGTLSLAPGVAVEAGSGAVQTLGALVGDGTCGQYIRLESSQAGASATVSVSAGAVDVSHYMLRDIVASGGATFAVSEALDNGGNVGWALTEATPHDYYWVGGSGGWSDAGVWSLTSGGEPTTCAPTRQDSAIFDASSFDADGAVVTLDLPQAECHHMIWTGAEHAPSVQGSADNHLSVHGDLVLTAQMTWGAQGDIILTSPGDKVIDAQGVNIGSYGLHLDDPDGSWTLTSELGLTGGYLYVDHGSFATGSHPMSVRRFISSSANPRTISLGASIINLNQFWFMSQTDGLTFDAGTSTIIWGASNTYRFEGGDQAFYDLQVSVGSGVAQIQGATTFRTIEKTGDGEITVTDGITVTDAVRLQEGSLALEGASTLEEVELSSGVVLRLQSEGTQTVGQLHGSFTGVTTILESTEPGTQATLSQTAGVVCLEHAQLTDIVATGGANFHAADSVDGGNNSGWSFGPCP